MTSTRQILKLSLVCYLPMILSGFWIAPPGVLSHSDLWPLLAGLAMAALLGLITVGFSRWSTQRTHWGRQLQGEFQQILGSLESKHILLLALLSAFGEEILFRGVLHPRLGLLPTALLFALLHFPYKRSM